MKPKGGQITHTPLSHVIHTTESPLSTHGEVTCTVQHWNQALQDRSIFPPAFRTIYVSFFRTSESYVLVERGTNSTPHLPLRFLQEMRSEGGSPLPPSEFTAN